LIFSTDFRKVHKFYANPLSGNRDVPCGRRTDRHDEANCRFPYFVKAPKRQQFRGCC